MITNLERFPGTGDWSPLAQELDRLRACTDPGLASALWFNCGVAFADRGLLPLAQASYERALQLNPTLWQAHANLAHLYEREGLTDRALSCYDEALNKTFAKEGMIHLHNQYGRLLEASRRFAPAIEQYAKSLALDGSQTAARQHLIYLAQKVCDWKLLNRQLRAPRGAVQPIVGPLSAMALLDTPAEIHEATQHWVDDYLQKHPIHKIRHPKRDPHQRLRLGYVSADFRMHAVGFLTAELYRTHDRSRFEIIGYDFSQNDNSAFRDQLLKDMDQVFDISGLSDSDAAALIAGHEIDILIDLMGFTANARPGIFMHKPAPIAISYLGFLGPCPIKEIDYLLCDAYVVPPEWASQYGAKPLYVDFYQINNRRRPVSLAPPPRAAYGLPEDAFVYCALNNSYKITEPVFRRWMSILKRTTHSVLWVLEENDQVIGNLRAQAEACGVDGKRLIFSGPTQPDEYLARFACADLFLDTYPYNAGITATDALWAGLPVLTVPGKTYVSRMAADLLRQLELNDLICENFHSYVKKAVEFSKRKKTDRAINLSKVHDSRIFDTPGFVAQYEELLLNISRRAQSPKQAQHQGKKTAGVVAQPYSKRKIYQIFYDSNSRAHLDPGFLPLNNSYSKTPELYELSAIRDYFSRYELADDTWYGFFSPKFLLKTGLRAEDVGKFFDQYKDDTDVMLFSPFWEQIAYFRNVFEQAEFWHPGIKVIARKFFNRINYPVDLDALVTCRFTSVFSNYFVAKGAFWRQWLSLADALIACMASRRTALASALRTPFKYGEEHQTVLAAVFLQERFASLLLASGRYRTVTCDISNVRSPLLPDGFNDEVNNALRLCDTLKASYRREPSAQYLQSFYRLREAVFGAPPELRKKLRLDQFGKTAPPPAVQALRCAVLNKLV